MLSKERALLHDLDSVPRAANFEPLRSYFWETPGAESSAALAAFIRGLQDGGLGSGRAVLATAKHYAVHSGPEPERLERARVELPRRTAKSKHLYSCP